ncbi:MAG: AAA family ATPase [Candidatus Methanomethylicaceae archaeon]
MAGFRIHEVSIQGFKGFTSKKTIIPEGKHLFILGPNGRGKSSIIEAVRWCLFGQLWRQNEIVANQITPLDCVVTMVLERDGEQWTLRRRLLTGTSGGSDVELRDSNGAVKNISEVFPQLGTVPTGEGLHIICSAQNPRHRISENLNPFERTILSYLGLHDIKSLTLELEKFLKKECEEERDKIARQIENIRMELEDKISDLNRKKDDLTSQLIDIFLDDTGIMRLVLSTLQELGVTIEYDGLKNKSIAELISKLEEEISKIRSGNFSHINNEIERLNNELEKEKNEKQDLENYYDEMNRYRKYLETKEQEVNNILKGKSLDDLIRILNDLEKNKKRSTLIIDMLNSALIYLENISHNKKIKCPICDSPFGSKDALHQIITNKLNIKEHKDKEVSRLINELKRKIGEVEFKNNEINTLRDRMIQAENNLRKIIKLENDKGLTDEIVNNSIQEKLNKISKLKNKLKEMEENKEDIEKWILNLENKLKHCKLSSEINSLISLITKFKRELDNLNNNATRHLNYLNEFIENLTIVQSTLNDIFIEHLRRELPDLNNRLTNAFRALTRQNSFDRLIIPENDLPKLELAVQSSNRPDKYFKPEQVLNGQALSAIQLVPYFAFAEMTDLALEVHAILLDDPTQSFDIEHINLLLKNLASLGRNVQLFIATHETERFRNGIDKHFKDGNFKILEIKDFDPDSGPKWDE